MDGVPRSHHDHQWWIWQHYQEPQAAFAGLDPQIVFKPADRPTPKLIMGPGTKPLMPPACGRVVLEAPEKPVHHPDPWWALH